MIRLTAFVLLSVFLFVAARAGDFEVYLNNQPVEGNVIMRKEKFYFPAVTLAKAMKLNFGISKETVWAGSIPDADAKGKLILNGAPFSDIIVSKGGIVYANLKGFCDIFGYKAIINQSTQLIDLIPADRATNHKEFQQELTRNLNKIFPESLLEDLKSRPELRDYLSKIRDWLLQSAGEEDKAAAQLERGLNQGANIGDMQDMYDAIASLNKGFQMEADSKSGLQKSFDLIVPPKEFENSHAILKKIADRFSEFEQLAQDGFVITKRMHPHTEVNGDMYRISIDEKLNKEIMVIGKRLQALDKQQLDDFLRYLEALKSELDSLGPVSKPVGTLF